MMKKASILKALGVTGMASAAYMFAGFMLAINPDGPPREQSEANQVEVPTSTVFVPIDLPLKLVETTVMQALGSKPIASGTSTKLIGDAFIAALKLPKPKRNCRVQVISETVMKQVQCRDITKGKNFGDGVSRFFECIGRAASTVITVPIAVVKEVTVCDPIKTVTETIAPIPELRYSAKLVGLGMRMSGSQILVEPKISVKLNLGFVGSVFDTLIPLKKSSCTLPVSVSSLADVEVSAAKRQLRLNIEIKQMDYKFDVGRCNGAFAGDLDLNGIEKILQGPLRDSLLSAMTKAVQSVLNAQSANPIAPQEIGAALGQVDKLLQAPFPVLKNPPVSISTAPEKILLSPSLASGAEGNHMLRIQAGLTAKPTISVFSTPDATPIKETPILMTRKTNEGFTLIPQAQVSLEEISKAANEVILSYLQQHAPRFVPRTLNVQAYQSGNRVVLGVVAKGLTFLNFSAEIFFTADPGFDPISQEVFLENIKFDAASSGELINRAAWLVEGPIEHLLETKLRFSPDPIFQQIITTLRDYTYEYQDLGRIHIALDKLEMHDFWVDDGALKIAIRADGFADLSTKITQLPKK